jgi:hypothetical protein
MGKIAKKLVKKPLLLVTFLLFLFTLCSCTVKSCKIAPDLEKIGDSALKNKENLAETNLKHANVRCKY